MSTKSALAVVAVAAAALLAGSVLYTVDERERAVVFQFGEIIAPDVEEGLNWKYPLINSVRRFDARIQTMDANPQEYLTEQKKNLVVDSFVKWRVEDPARYYVTVAGDETAAERRLAQRVNDSLREEFGKRSVQEVVSGDRSQIMSVVRETTDQQAREIGIEVVDVRLKRVDLVDEVSERVYRRMEAERSRVAKELRAMGAEEAEKIRSDADRQRRIIIANAQRKAQMIRGEGDARATRIYAGAFDRNEKFYALYRSLNAYETTFNSRDDLLVLEPDSQFFKYFNDSTPLTDVPPAEQPRDIAAPGPTS